VFTLFFMNQPWAWIVILAVVLLLFGATRLPALSRSLGQSIKSFRSEMKDDGQAAEPAKADPAANDAVKPDADKV
jgi:sec-independent protein translocase protein TatA